MEQEFDYKKLQKKVKNQNDIIEEHYDLINWLTEESSLQSEQINKLGKRVTLLSVCLTAAVIGNIVQIVRELRR